MLTTRRDHASGLRAVVTAFGDTPLDAVDRFLRLEAQPPPQPRRLEPLDVIVAVKSAQLGWVDLLMTSGQYQQMPAPPYTPGLEYSGEVAWVGDAVTRFRVGDRVIVDALGAGPRSSGAYQRWGGFASWAVAPEHALRALPATFSFEQGANYLGNYETAYHCLLTRGRLAAGEIVLIHGSSGSTGLAAVQLAKLVGATVIATGRSPEKLAVVREEGADHVVPIATGPGDDGPRFRDEVKALTGGRGVDVVYDSVGGAISLESLRCVAFGARFLIVGWASTPFVAHGGGKRGAPNANLLATNLIMMKGLDVLGCPTAIATIQDPSLREPRLSQLERWAEAGALVPRVGGSFPLAQVAEAMRAKWESRFVGGIVVLPPAA
jgi:NADPH:quinone reductase